MTNDLFDASSVRRSYAIVRAAWETLSRHPRLAWFPVVLVVGTLALLAFGAAIVGVAGLTDDPGAGTRRAASVAGIVVYFGGHLLSVATGVALTHASLEALAGRPWTVQGAFERVALRREAVITFAIVSATVAWVLGGSRKREGKPARPGVLRSLLGLAWSAATYLTLPVLAREDRSAFGAIERSATLLQGTWKEIAIARLSLWWVWIPVVVAAFTPALLCVLFGVREPSIVVPAVFVPFFAIGAFALFLYTLEGIYRAALYTYATEGVVPGAFDDGELAAIWEASPGSGSGDDPDPALD